MSIAPMSNVVRRIRSQAMRSEESLSDGQLLDSFIKEQDQAAFAVLMRRHADMVWGVCSRVVGAHHDAEDAFQATFLVLVRKAATIVPRDMVANWLYGVAHLTALKARATGGRRRSKERQVTQMPEPSVPAEATWQDLQPVLDQELSRLPQKFRAAIVLCDLEGRTRKEAAQLLKLPEGTVASRLATARAILSKRFRQRGIVLSGGALGVLLSQNVGGAAPSSLLTSTIEVANVFAAGPEAAVGAVPVKVAALTDGVLKNMLANKLKIATAAIIAITITIGGIGGALHRSSAAETTPTASIPAIVTPAQPPAEATPTPANPNINNPAQPIAANTDEADKPKSNVEMVVGSGKLITKEFPASKFHSVHAGGAFEIEITHADSFKVTVTSDDNVMQYIKVDAKDDALDLALEHGNRGFQNATFKATIAMPVLNGLHLDGATKATLKGAKSEKGFKGKLSGAAALDGELETQNAELNIDGAGKVNLKGSAKSMTIKANGAADINFGDVAADGVDLRADGAAKVHLKGSAKSLTIKSGGASQLSLGNLAVESANLHLSGACQVTVDATKQLDYSLSGACTLHYAGSPKIGRQEKSGASTASHK